VKTRRESRAAGFRPAIPGLGIVLWLVTVAPAGAQELTWGGSADLTSGDYYFTETTTSVWISNGLYARLGALRLDASMPFVLQNSDVVTRVAGLPVPTGGPRHSGDVSSRGSGTGTGMGSGTGTMSSMVGDSANLIQIEQPGSLTLELADPLLGAGVELATSSAVLTSVRFGVSAKAPLRSAESGIGTGEWDVGIGGGASFAAGRLYVLVDATWWSLGDMPDLELDDILAYGASLGGPFGEGSLGWSLSLWGSTPMIDGIDPPVSVGGDLYVNSISGRSLRFGLRFGLTDSAADVGGSVGWSIPIMN
jgi:hypothetical protein